MYEEQMKKIQENQDSETITSLLKDIVIEKLTTRQFSDLIKALKKCEIQPDIKIAYLANFTIDMLPSYVSVFAAKEKLNTKTYIGPYNQYVQEILLENSGLHLFNPDVIFLSLTLSLIHPQIVSSFSSMNDSEKEASLEEIIKHLQEWIIKAKDRTNATILITNFPLPAYIQNGIADTNDSFSESLFYLELNKRLADLAREEAKVHIFDLAKLFSRFGTENIYDPKMYFIAKILWKEQFLPVIAKECLRFVIAIKGLTRKCLILDLDNTLWGGVVGEEGVHGVKIGTGDPVSEAYYEFQNKIKTLKNRGVMLAICSKNNENDILELFEKREEMPLTIDDFIARRINWEHKHSNIVDMAKELNIGVESMVFLDDNPVECEMVQTMLPNVKVYQVPSRPELIPGFIDEIIDFEKISILKEDREKTDQYHQKRNREKFKETIGDVNEYLESLQTEILIRNAEKKDIERVHQLFVKTNQFNVTTKRYSIGDIEFFNSSDMHELIVISAKDKFGDLGIIGLCLLEYLDQGTNIDSFILSCRAMGRNIEDAIMNHIKSLCFSKRKSSVLKAVYIPTAKNIPVKDFFDNQGFEIIETMEGGEKKYKLISEKWQMIKCSAIKIQRNDDIHDRKN